MIGHPKDKQTPRRNRTLVVYSVSVIRTFQNIDVKAKCRKCHINFENILKCKNQAIMRLGHPVVLPVDNFTSLTFCQVTN